MDIANVTASSSGATAMAGVGLDGLRGEDFMEILRCATHATDRLIILAAVLNDRQLLQTAEDSSAVYGGHLTPDLRGIGPDTATGQVRPGIGVNQIAAIAGNRHLVAAISEVEPAYRPDDKLTRVARAYPMRYIRTPRQGEHRGTQILRPGRPACGK